MNDVKYRQSNGICAYLKPETTLRLLGRPSKHETHFISVVVPATLQPTGAIFEGKRQK